MKPLHSVSVLIENMTDEEEEIVCDKRVFNLNTHYPYFIKEQGDYFGKYLGFKLNLILKIHQIIVHFETVGRCTN